MAPTTPATKTVLLIDIAHNSIGVGVLSLTSGMRPRMLAIWREHLHPDPSDERLFEYTLRSMRKLIEKANTAGYSSWDEVRCTVGTPWVITQVRSASSTHEKPVLVTERMLQDLDDRDRERFFARDIHAGVFAEFGHVLQHERLTTLVNGHAMKRPVGQRAREVSGTYVLAAMSEDYYAALRSGIYAVTHREPEIQSVQFAVWQALMQFDGVQNTALFDFHGGFGECLVVRDGQLAVTVASSLSENRYIADLAEALSLSSQELRKKIDMESTGILHDSFAVELKEAEDLLLVRYQNEMKDLLQSISEQTLLPQQVFILADYSRKFFHRLLSLSEFASFALMHQPIIPAHFSSELLHDRIDTHAMNKEDNALCMLALSVSSK